MHRSPQIVVWTIEILGFRLIEFLPSAIVLVPELTDDGASRNELELDNWVLKLMQ